MRELSPSHPVQLARKTSPEADPYLVESQSGLCSHTPDTRLAISSDAAEPPGDRSAGEPQGVNTQQKLHITVIVSIE